MDTAMHTLSDERCEYLIKDRLSFMRFVGLGLADAVPDANTIWTFREALKRSGAIEVLFARFDVQLKAAGYLAMSGQIVDASIVSAPKQRNPEAEKAQLGRKEPRSIQTLISLVVNAGPSHGAIPVRHRAGMKTYLCARAASPST